MESRSIAYRPAYYREVVERVREKARRTIEHYLAGYYKCLRKDDYSHADTLKKVEARRAEKWVEWEADQRKQGIKLFAINKSDVISSDHWAIKLSCQRYGFMQITFILGAASTL